MMSDGFIDQNNVERKRFGTNNLLDKLKQIKDLKVSEQKVFLENELDNWMYKTEQRDDITLWAVKI